MNVQFSPDDLRPLVETVVAETLARIAPVANGQSERLSYTEEEAATLCGINRHNLRDARLAGELEFSRLGKRVCYTRENLTRWIASRRDR